MTDLTEIESWIVQDDDVYAAPSPSSNESCEDDDDDLMVSRSEGGVNNEYLFVGHKNDYFLSFDNIYLCLKSQLDC